MILFTDFLYKFNIVNNLIYKLKFDQDVFAFAIAFTANVWVNISRQHSSRR